jgi:hypothetical protein
VFIPRGVLVAPAATILGGVFLAEGTAWLSVVALLGDRLNAVLSRASVRRRMEQLTGLVMIGFGHGLLWSGAEALTGRPPTTSTIARRDMSWRSVSRIPALDRFVRIGY